MILGFWDYNGAARGAACSVVTIYLVQYMYTSLSIVQLYSPVQYSTGVLQWIQFMTQVPFRQLTDEKHDISVGLG